MIDPPITKLAAFFWLAVRFNRFPPTNRPYIPTKKGIAKNIEKKPLKKNKEITKKKGQEGLPSTSTAAVGGAGRCIGNGPN